ncbi:MAG: hypothetical protein JJU32_09350 [Phormidium sp. BM_Day4_Bin.17]|nr:hypothetical protein [Phormidium sp. BM_Day4_Bin.17]UCJ11718.1 MAG: hypothetical protein JWS08_18555 [Phormidium sp. PBR-2020]
MKILPVRFAIARALLEQPKQADSSGWGRSPLPASLTLRILRGWLLLYWGVGVAIACGSGS